MHFDSTDIINQIDLSSFCMTRFQINYFDSNDIVDAYIRLLGFAACSNKMVSVSDQSSFSSLRFSISIPEFLPALQQNISCPIF